MKTEISEYVVEYCHDARRNDLVRGQRGTHLVYARLWPGGIHREGILDQIYNRQRVKFIIGVGRVSEAAQSMNES